MRHISELIDQALSPLENGPEKDKQETVQCRACGTSVAISFPEVQWTLHCPACGNVITLTKKYRLFRKFIPPEKRDECIYCEGRGILLIPRQVDESYGEYAYRCICPAGRARPETGIPMAVDVDLSPVLRRRKLEVG